MRELVIIAHQMLHQKPPPDHTRRDFRWRSSEITRIEGLSDAVFAIAVALLIVSVEVPKTFDARLHNVGEIAERLVKPNPVIAFARLQ